MAKKNKRHTLTVNELLAILMQLVDSKTITIDTEIWLSSDGEGNDFAPLVRFEDGKLNASVDGRKKKLTLYPLN